MAEVLAVVASGAGLASLAFQLADVINRLRKRCENLQRLRASIGKLIEDLESIRNQLQTLALDHVDISEVQLGLVIQDRCRDRCEDVIRRLENLITIISKASARFWKRRALRTLFESKKWKTELEELRIAIMDLKLDFNQLLLRNILTGNSHTSFQRKQTTKFIEQATDTEENLDLMIETVPKEHAALIRRRSSGCATLSCHCSCHATRKISRRFWYLQYTTLADVFRKCDNVLCTARRHGLEIRTALLPLGISWAIMLGVDITIEAGKASLLPALQVQRVVRYTSPGFVIIWKLSQHELNWDDAEAQLETLYQCDPTFANQVDPSGCSYLEKVVSGGFWDYFFPGGIDTRLQLLQLFIKRFHMTLGLDSSAFMYGCISLLNESCQDTIDSLMKLGCDFSNTPSPNFSSWPKPCPDDLGLYGSIAIMPPDPFFIKSFRTIVHTNSYFGGTTPLHNAILNGSFRDLKLLIQTSKPLENNINFLGQTPLHLSIYNPLRLKALLDAGHDLDVSDSNGITALMYAATMNRRLTLSILIKRGADLLRRDNLEEYDFIMYAATRNNWSITWHAVDVIDSMDRSLLLPVLSRIVSAPKPPDFSEKGQAWRVMFWSNIISKAGPNLVKLGFTVFNQQNDAGEHSLFSIAKFNDPQLLEFCLEKGANPNLKDQKGHTILRRVTDRICYARPPVLKNILDSMDILLNGGANVNLIDHCSCICSSGGCLSTSGLIPEFLAMFYSRIEERGKSSDARMHALSILHRVKFDQMGLRHTCCQHGLNEEKDLEEDKFWDIHTLIQADRLNDEMRVWESSSYEEIKVGLIKNLRFQSKLDMERDVEERVPIIAENATGQIKHLVEEPPDRYIDYKNDRIYSNIEIFLSSFKFDKPWNFSKNKDHAQECFEKFAVDLREARGNKFLDRVPFLRQLSGVLGLDIRVEDF